MDLADTTIPGARYVENLDHIKNIADLYQNKFGDAFLQKYLIFCFMHKMTDNIKSIIMYLNLPNTTRLKYRNSAIQINVSFLAVGVLCNDIKFVKFLLNNNKSHDYDINSDFSFFDCSKSSCSLFLNKTTPLYIAIIYTKNRDMIDLLIQYGADINTTDDNGATPLMKVVNKEPDLKYYYYYDFLISRGANGKTALHYVTEDKNFDVALHLIENHGANPYLSDNQNNNNNIFMTFAIELSSYDHYDENTDDGRPLLISPPYDKKVYYIEKLLKVTRPPRHYVRLTYELFAACIFENPSLKRQYFDKANNIHGRCNNNNNNNKWIERFNSIVGNDNDEKLYIQSTRVFNRLLIIYNYDYNIRTILDEILPWYRFHYQYDKCLDLLLYVLDLVTDNVEAYKNLYSEPVGNIYAKIFMNYNNIILKTRDNHVSLENVFKYFGYMLNKFMERNDFFKNEKYGKYGCLVKAIHTFIIGLYKKCYYDATKRKSVENFIKHEHPVNLLTKDDECILHLVFYRCSSSYDDEEEEVEITKAFISFILTSTNFKHLNLRSFIKVSPLSLALQKNLHIDYIRLLLDNGSVIDNNVKEYLNWVWPKYRDLNIFDNYTTLQSLAAQTIVNNNNNGDYKNRLPKVLGDFVDDYYR